MPAQGLAPLIGLWLLIGGADAPQSIIKPAPPAAGTKHYLVQVRISEVDEQGRLTVIASPMVQTTGAAAGVTIDSERGRRFEFHFSATEPGAPSPLPVVLADEDIAPKPIAVTSSTAVAIDRVKGQRITLKAVQQPRKIVLREIARQAGLKFTLEPDSAVAAAQLLTAPVTVEFSNTPLEEAMNQLTGQSKLTYSLESGLLIVSAEATPSDVIPAPTPKVAADSLIVMVYDVSDLVAKDAATGRPDFQSLIQRLRADVQPKTWDAAGGEVTVRGFDSTVSLVIRQTPAGHAAVAKFLEQLRTKAQ